MLTVEEVKSFVRSMARSTGLYGRLARDLDENDAWEAFTDGANEAGCKDTLDLVLWWEGG